MTKLAPHEIAAVAREAGFSGVAEPTAPIVIAVAIAMAESGGDPGVVSKPNRDGSADRGLWQLNNRALPQVSDSQALDPAGAAKAAYEISRQGTYWRPWVAYTSGAYAQHLYLAQGGVLKADLIRRGAIAPGGDPYVPSGPSNPLSGVTDFLGALTQPHTWLRVLYVVGGVSLALVGVATLIGSPGLASVTPIGRAVKALT